MLNFLKSSKTLWLLVFSVVFALIILLNTLSPSVYESKATIMMHRKIPDGYQDTTQLSALDVGLYLRMYAHILSSDMVLNRVSEKLTEAFPKHKKVSKKRLRKQLNVANERGTKLIQISFRDGDPKFSQAAVNVTLDAFETALRNIYLARKVQGGDFIKIQLARVKKERKEAEKRISTYLRGIGAISVENKYRDLSAVIERYQTKISTLDGTIIETRSRVESLRQLVGVSQEDIQPLSRIVGDEKLTKWQTQLSEEYLKLTTLKSRYTDKHYLVRRQYRTIDDLKVLIEERMSELYGRPVTDHEKDAFNRFDPVQGKELTQLSTLLVAYDQQRARYEELLVPAERDLAKLISDHKEIEGLTNRVGFLRQQEKELTNTLHQVTVDRAIIENVKNFTVISPPRLPRKGDNIFPLSPEKALLGGLLVSAVVATTVVFTLGLLVEQEAPSTMIENTPTILGELYHKASPGANRQVLKSIYQELGVQVQKHNYQTVALTYFEDRQRSRTKASIENRYALAAFSRELALMFSQHGKKVLVVDSLALDTDYPNETPIRGGQELMDHTLYAYKGMQNCHVLRTDEQDQPFFDPFLIDMLRHQEGYDLVLLALEKSDAQGIQQAADATVWGISKRNTNMANISMLQHQAREEEISITGAILFP